MEGEEVILFPQKLFLVKEFPLWILFLLSCIAGFKAIISRR